MSAFEYYQKISGMSGSTSEVGKRIGKSKSFVSVMRKIKAAGSPRVIRAWGKGKISTELVRAIVTVPADTQDTLLSEYLDTIAGGSKAARGEARHLLYKRLGKAL